MITEPVESCLIEQSRTNIIYKEQGAEAPRYFCTLLQLQATGSLLRMGTSLGATHLQQEAAVTAAVAAEALRLVVARVVPSGHEKVRHEALRNAK